MRTHKGFYYGKFAVLGILGIIVFTFVVMLLWNWLVPAVFSGPVLTYWQTLGLLILSKILFSGIGGGRRYRSHSREHYCKDREKWRERYEEKMNGKVDEASKSGPEKEPGESEVIQE